MTLHSRLTIALVAVPTLFTLVDCSSPSESRKFDSEPEALSAFGAGVYTIADARTFAIDGGYHHWNGTPTEELYTLTAGNTYQQWQFTSSGSGFTICNVGDGGKVCLSDGGSTLTIGSAADIWTVASSASGYSLQDQKTGRFIGDAASPGNGAVVPVSSTATGWSLAALTPPFAAGTYTIADSKTFAIDGGYFHWSGTTAEALYALTASNTFQQWTFAASGSGFTICNVADGANVCLSDGGSALEVGVAADVWTVAASGAGYTLQDQTTQHYITDAASPGDGAAVGVSTSATVWNLASLGGSTGGADGGTTNDSGAADSGGGSPPPTSGCTGSLAGLTVSPSNVSFGSSTIGEGTTTSLLTVSNGGGSAIAIGSVGIGGANGSDFSEQSDCPASLPASLPAGDKCYVRVDFKPTTTGSRVASAAINGSCSSSLTGTGLSLASAFFVSPSGSDVGGNGSLSAPWQTLAKAQKAMQAGSTKTTYLRAGVYSPGGSGLQLGGSDDNETWSFYPPDGVDSAIIDGGSTRSGTGVDVLVGVGGTSHVTIDGLTVRNFDGWGIGGYNASNLTVKNSVIYNGFSTAQYGAQGIACGNDCVSWSLLNNVMHDITGGGANVVAAQTGNISHLIYSGNVVYDTCTSPDDGGDCGALYTQDNLGQSTDITISGNFVRDGNPWRGHDAGSGIYLDDCLSNATVSGNVLTGTNGANTTFIHGGSNDVYVGNIIDLGPYDQAISVLQTSASNTCSNKMTGNKYVQNIILGTTGGGGWGALSWPLPALPTVEDNLFYGYGGPALSNNWDTHATVADPQLSGCFDLSAASPAYRAPVDFPALLKNWGPPGYQLPSGATAPPSYASPTCK